MKPVNDFQRLDYMVNVEGIDQVTASRMLWAPELLDPPVVEPDPAAALAEQVDWARARAVEIVHEGLADVLAWLRGGTS